MHLLIDRTFKGQLNIKEMIKIRPYFRRTCVSRRRKTRDKCAETRSSKDRGRVIICQLRVASGEPKRRAPWRCISSLRDSETTHCCCLNDQVHACLSWQLCKLRCELCSLPAVNSRKLRTEHEVHAHSAHLPCSRNPCIFIFLLWLTSFYFNFIRLLFVFIVCCFKAFVGKEQDTKK